MPHISVVTTLYRSAPYIEEFYARSQAAVVAITDDYEIVFVDDGSPDDSREKVHELIAKDPRVRLVELSRNFGHHKAIMAGLEYARGDFVFLIDADLEEEPELLTKFYTLMQEDERQLDVVYGYMQDRKGSAWERISGALFYKIINLFSEIHIPENAMIARLMTQDYVRSLSMYGESHVFLGGVLQLAGYRQLGVPARKHDKGSTSYTLNLKVQQAMDAILSFTNKPLTYVAALGLAISGISFLVLLAFMARQLMYDSPIEPWAILLASVWFIGGLTIFSIGLVGFYVGRIFLQVKRRPNAIVRRVYNFDSEKEER